MTRYILFITQKIIITTAKLFTKKTKKTRSIWSTNTRFLRLYLMLFHVSNSCYFMSQIHAISYLKSWCMTIISEIKEREESAMYLICWHAMSQSVSHAFQCLKCWYRIVISETISCLKSWCMTTISEVRESEDDAIFLTCLHANSQPVFHAIACLKCMLFLVSNACYFVPQILIYDDY